MLNIRYTQIWTIIPPHVSLYYVKYSKQFLTYDMLYSSLHYFVIQPSLLPTNVRFSLHCGANWTHLNYLKFLFLSPWRRPHEWPKRVTDQRAFEVILLIYAEDPYYYVESLLVSRWEAFTRFGISQRRLIVVVNDAFTNENQEEQERVLSANCCRRQWDNVTFPV